MPAEISSIMIQRQYLKGYQNTVHIIDMISLHFFLSTNKFQMLYLLSPCCVPPVKGNSPQTLSQNYTYLDSCWIEFSCSNFVRCSPSTRLTISLITVISALNWFNVSPFSMLSGIRNGRIFVAISSFVIPSFLCVNANL